MAREQVCLVITNKVPEHSAVCPALSVALWCRPGPVTGLRRPRSAARRTHSPGDARSSRLPHGPQGLGYDHDCGVGVAALRGGGTGNSDLSGPAAVAPFVSAGRPRAGAASCRALRPAASAGTAVERCSLSSGQAARGKGRKFRALFLFILERQLFFLPKKKKKSHKLFFETPGYAAGTQKTLDSGF